MIKDNFLRQTHIPSEIFEAVKGSEFYQKEEKKHLECREKILRYRSKIASYKRDTGKFEKL